MTQMIKNIVVVGGDLHAWSVAVGLLAGLRGQQTKITVVDSSESALPGVVALDLSAHEFHRTLGITEPVLVSHIGGAYSYGVRYKGIGEKASEFSYTHSPTAEMIDRVEFHHYLSRLRLLGGHAEFADYSIASIAAQRNSFTHPQPDSVLDQLDYSMQVDRLRYQHFLKSSALERGIAHLQANVVDATRASESGQFESLTLSNGSRLACDFVFDCAGALSADHAQSEFEDWEEFVPFNRKFSWAAESSAETPVLNQCAKLDQGYLRTLVLPGGEYREFFYNDALLDEHALVDYAHQRFGRIPPEMSQISSCVPGVRRAPWSGNSLAIGSAAGFAGNLLFGELFHTHTAIQRWLALCPGQQVNPLLAEEYNRRTSVEYEHVRDVHGLLLGESANMVSNTLAHRIELFQKTGRVAFYESDVLEKHQWINLFIGCGIWPQRADPMLNQLSRQKLEGMLSTIARQSVEVAAQFPKHDLLLKAIRQSA